MTNRRVTSLLGLTGSVLFMAGLTSCGGSSGNNNPDASTDGHVVADVKPHPEAAPDVEKHDSTPTGVAITVVVPTGEGSVLSQDHQIYCGFGDSCVGYYPLGTVLTLTEARSIEYIFKGWGGAVCSPSGTSTTCVFTVSGPETITVSYEIPPLVPLTVSVAPGSTSTGCTVTSNPAGISTGGTEVSNFPEGTGITLTAIPGVSRTFSKWVGGQCGSGTQASMSTCKFGLGGPDTEMATFTCTYGYCP